MLASKASTATRVFYDGKSICGNDKFHGVKSLCGIKSFCDCKSICGVKSFDGGESFYDGRESFFDNEAVFGGTISSYSRKRQESAKKTAEISCPTL